jgi:hypothetical protein
VSHIGRVRNVSQLGVVVCLVAGCAASAATQAPSPVPTFPPDPAVAPAGFIEAIGQLTEDVGGHGGARAVDLPAMLAIDYWVSGTCDFEITIVPDSGNSTPVATFAMKMLGSTVSDTWHVSIQPASYVVLPADAPGCRFSVTVRAA